MLERFDDSRASRAKLLVGRVELRRKEPVNRRFERTLPAADENHDVIARYGAKIASSHDPADLEAERIAIMPLRPPHVFNRKLGVGEPNFVRIT